MILKINIYLFSCCVNNYRARLGDNKDCILQNFFFTFGGNENVSMGSMD